MTHYITGHNLLQPSAPDTPLDFNPDPNVVARARVALIVHTAKQNQRDTAWADRLAEIEIERALEEFQ